MPPQVSADGPGKGAAEQQADAEDVYKQWLLRQYNSYQLQLLQVMVESKFATVQVSTQAISGITCIAPQHLEHVPRAWLCT